MNNVIRKFLWEKINDLSLLINGGRTVVENCQMLCRECNRRKGAK